jgi:hypothetical protein
MASFTRPDKRIAAFNNLGLRVVQDFSHSIKYTISVFLL